MLSFKYVVKRKHLSPIYFVMTLCASLLLNSPVSAGVLYSQKELLAGGSQYIETSCQWKAEKATHTKRMDHIKSMQISDLKKDYLFKREMSRHRDRSDILAAKRDQVQEMLVLEANARVKGSKGPVSGELKDTAGTKFGDEGHRGMAGDRDMGGGSNTARKVEDVLQEMGLYDPKNPKNSVLVVDSKAGTLEIGGDFELTINKDGLKPRPGTEFHQVKVDVDARNPETYVSESMKTRKDGKLVRQQIGTEYVEVQDHRKKASDGLVADGDGLVKKPKKMQGMAKGTSKTLDMGRIDDDTLGKILKQNGLKDSPIEFKNKLKNIKEGHITIGDAKQAERMRRVSEDVFNAAEQATFKQAKRDIVDLRAKAASKPPNDPVRLQIEEEIVDTVTKMKRTKAINDEVLSTRKRPDLMPDASPPKTKVIAKNVDVELKKIEIAQPSSVKQRAAKTFGAVMQVADIGQTCQAVEDYVEGKASLADTTLVVVDQYITQGAIGTGKHIYNTTDDYLAARKDIQKANQNNMTAYLNQWTVRLHKTGMSPKEARKYVGNAMLSGDLDLLNRKARVLRAEGKDIEDPKLVSETLDADDTLWERTKNTGYGVGKGLYDSISYPIRAPGRMVEAWAEGELAEAQLDAYARSQDASSRSTVFQKLIAAGVDSGVALNAINAYEDNNFAPLRKLFKETRDKIKAEQTAAIAAAEAAEKEIQAQADRMQNGLKKYFVYVNFLMTTPMKLNTDPVPIELENEGVPVLVEMSLDNEQDNFLNVAHGLNQVIADISGTPGTVKIAYTFSVPGKKGRNDNMWLTKSPGFEGIYPVTAEVDVDIVGPGLTGVFANLNRSFTREQFAKVEVTTADSEYDYSKGIWPELLKTKRTVVTIEHLASYRGDVGASGTISYDFKSKRNETDWESGQITIKMSGDGRGMDEITKESTHYMNGKAFQKDLLVVKNFKLYSLKEETPTQATTAYYTLKKEEKYIWGTKKWATINSDGEWKWGKNLVVGDARSNKKVETHLPSVYVHFYMDEQTVSLKRKKRDELRNQKKASEKAQKEQAQGGSFFRGPIGEEEGFKGNIEINIGKDEKSIQGEFKCNQEMDTGKKHIKAYASGEFLGVIDPKTGEMEANFTNSSLFTAIKKEGKWYPTGSFSSLPKKAKMIGTFDGKTFTGYIGMGAKKSFAWTAKPAKKQEDK